MPQEPAQAVPTAQAADSTDFNQPAARNAGEHVEGADGSSAGNSLPEPSTTTTGDPAVGAELDRLLSGAKSVDEVQRLTSQFLNGQTPGKSLTGVQGKDYPVDASQEPADHPEDIAKALAEGKPRPQRIRIASLPDARQDLILALSDPNKPIEEVLRGLAPATPQTATAPAAAPATIPGLPALPSARTIDLAALTAPTESSKALRDQIADLRQQRRTASAGMDLEAANALEDQIEAIRDRLPQVEQAERSHQQARTEAFDHSRQSVRTVYPDASVANSALSVEMIRIAQQWESANNHLHRGPDGPMLLAARAAANLGVAPRTGTAPVAPAAPLKPVPVSASTPRAASPASLPPSPVAGGARTQAPSVAADQDQFDKTLSSATGTNDILALTRLLG